MDESIPEWDESGATGWVVMVSERILVESVFDPFPDELQAVPRIKKTTAADHKILCFININFEIKNGIPDKMMPCLPTVADWRCCGK
jgi:hypothetical protein